MTWNRLQKRWAAACSAMSLSASLCANCGGSDPEPAAGTGGEGQGGLGGAENPDASTNWVGSWATGAMVVDDPGLSGNTLRQIVRTSIGGSGYRLKFENALGDSPMELAGVRAALSTGSGSIDPGTDRQVTFDGSTSISIPAGQAVYSDPVELALAPMADLSVSIHFGAVPSDVTGHAGARATSYVQPGDATSAVDLESPSTNTSWFVLTGIDVDAVESAAAVAVLGNSITDGYGVQPDTNQRWTDVLSVRLREDPETQHVGVLNLGISGNALLSGGLGPTARQRFERDVLSQSGVHWVVVFIGVNDLGASNGLGITEAMIESYEELVDVAHSAGLLVYGVPILPFGGADYDLGERLAARDVLNEWMREAGPFDAVLPIDEAVADEADSDVLASTLDSGDHLHPSMAGYEAIAHAIDLDLFSDPTLSPRDSGSGATSLAPGFPCSRFEPNGPLINDFSSWSGGNWTGAEPLSGGTFYYDGDGDDSVQALSIAVTDEIATVSGQVDGGYAGFGFWFGPCIDASSSSGISFEISGDLDGATLEFQIQTTENYPIDETNKKGSCDGGWSDCGSNSYSIQFEGPDAAVIEVPWSELTGGRPVPTTDGSAILGLQWQVNCSGCTPEFTLDDVQFYDAP